MCFDVNADIARFYSVCFELAVLKLYRLAHTGARAHATHARVEKNRWQVSFHFVSDLAAVAASCNDPHL